jgi:glycosyltransferase involved in cell wall biosynthesis
MVYISHWPAFYTDWDLYRVVRNRIAESIPVHLCDKTICISPENHYQYQIRFPRLQDKFLQICNPFDIEAPSPSGAVAVRRQFGWSEEQIHVVSVGRLSSQKHVEWLLESWLEVQKRVPAARLWIIGSGEDENQLHSLAVKLEIERTCTFLGAQKNGIDFINACDVVAMTSLYEGHSNVPMEAHLCGKPIVANSVDGVKVSITEGIDGFLVPPGDTAAFSQRLVELCDSVEIRKRMGDHGKKSVLKFSVKIIMESYSKLITDLIGE